MAGSSLADAGSGLMSIGQKIYRSAEEWYM
jgi:hypothetical protein